MSSPTSPAPAVSFGAPRFDGTAETAWLDDEAPIYGTCADRFARVREVFAAHLNGGADVGAAVAVVLDGELVVDLWGGYFDPTYTRPWDRDTIVNGFSSTKTMTALCALLLADRGEIDLDAPAAHYWPEFAAAGKGLIAVRQFLDYTSGMAGWSEPLTLGDLYDHERSSGMLARQAPWWEPGSAAGYHAFTVGHLVGEVVRRVTGKSLGAYLAEEIAGPLGVGAHYHIGTGPEYDKDVSPLIQGCLASRQTGHLFYDRALFNPAATPQDSWQLPFRRAEIGAINGHGNARAIARIQSLLACGEAGSLRLSEAGRARVLEVGRAGTDVVLGVPITWGLGYCLDAQFVPEAAGSRVAFWAGGGGSMSWVDLSHRMSFGFTPNRWVRGIHEQDRSKRLLGAVYEALAR